MGSPQSHPIYFVQLDGGARVLLRSALPVDLHPHGEFILHRALAAPHPWTVTEVTTGRRVAIGSTRDEATEAARARLQAFLAKGASLELFVRAISHEPHSVLSD